MTDGSGLAAIITASLGGLATLCVAIATLIATLKGNREIAQNRNTLNGRMDELLEAARQGAYLAGVEEGRRQAGQRDGRPKSDGGPGPGPKTG